MSHLRQRPDRFGRYEREVSDPRVRRGAFEDPEPGPIGQRLTAAALALTVAAFLAVYGLATITNRPAAVRILARAVPNLTEVDRLMALHGDELRTQAQNAPNQALTLPGFPLRVALTPEEVRSHSSEGLQILIDQRAAAAIYDHGAAAFTAPGGRGVDETGPILSAPWTVHESFVLLNARQHGRFARLALLLGLAGIALILLLCLQVRSYGRMVGIGAAVLSGALLIGLLTFFFWLTVQFYSSASSTPLAIAGWGIIADGSWTMVLVDVVGALVGAALLTIGLLFAGLDRRQPAPRALQPARFAPQIDRRRRRPTED